MKNKENAFTLMEVIMVMTVIGVIVTMLIMIFKPRLARNNAYKVRATINTIEKVNETLLTERRESGKWGFDWDADELSEGQTVVGKYCELFADSVATQKDSNCGSGRVVLPNGVNIIDLTSGNWTEGTSDSGETFFYRDIQFCTDTERTCTTENDEYTENKDIFKVRILKNEPYVIPVGYSDSGSTNELLNEDKIIRYKVISLGKRNNGIFIQDYKVLAQNVSFGYAACLTGLADKYLTEDEMDNYEHNHGICPDQNTENCENYFDCKIELMDVPTQANMYTPRKD